MKKNKKMKRLVIFIVLVIGIIISMRFLVKGRADGTVDPRQTFAYCLGEKGAKFYGAFWCPHCQNQKKMFGRAQKFLPYVECSNKNMSQTQACIDAGIESYPTWIFADESRLTGEIPMQVLSEKTGCVVEK